MSFGQLPTAPGAYRWFYADAHVGDFTAVAIFMVGSVFSPRYVTAAERGAAPGAHSAVNFALYRRGQRVAWVLSEYPNAKDTDGVLRIGNSTWAPMDGGWCIEIDERLALPFGRPVRARLTLRPEVPRIAPLSLGEGHAWHPIAVRCRAALEVPTFDVDATGSGYHDSNFGPSPLGISLPGWRWTRVHDRDASQVLYELPGPEAIHLTARDGEVRTQQVPSREVVLRRTRWGLALPTALPFIAGSRGISVVESSPFYARLESEADSVHALGEVADFRRFRSPWIRWMAYFRTRVEVAR